MAKTERVKLEDGMFFAAMCEGCQTGTCVMLNGDSVVVYAGPILGAPPVDGLRVLLHPEDYRKLEAMTKRRQN